MKINLITFGSPRVGNINLQKAMRVKAKSIGRFVTPNDPVPSSPPNEKVPELDFILSVIARAWTVQNKNETSSF